MVAAIQRLLLTPMKLFHTNNIYQERGTIIINMSLDCHLARPSPNLLAGDFVTGLGSWGREGKVGRPGACYLELAENYQLNW